MESSCPPPPLKYSTSVFWRWLEVEAGECPTGLARRVLVPSQWNVVGANNESLEHGHQCQCHPAVPWFRYRLLRQRHRSRQRVLPSAEFVELDVGRYTGRSSVKYDRRRTAVKTGTEVSHAACMPTRNSYEARNNAQTCGLHVRNKRVTKSLRRPNVRHARL